MWTRRCEFYLAQPLMLATRHTHPALAALEREQSPAIADYHKSWAERFLGALDRQLAGRSFICADRITMADIVAAVGIDFARLIKYRPPSDLVNVDRWYEAMKARPGFSAGA